MQLEERRKFEESNKSLVVEELERTRLDIDAEKAEIQMRAAEGKKYTTKEGEELEIKVAEMKAEKSVVTLQVDIKMCCYTTSRYLKYVVTLQVDI